MAIDFIDILPVILGESKEKEPAIPAIGCHDGSSPASFPPPWHANPFLDQPAPEICINQARLHLADGVAKNDIVQTNPTGPASKGSQLEDSSATVRHMTPYRD